jgi:UDP-glucose 6-dehydrogenase
MGLFSKRRKQEMVIKDELLSPYGIEVRMFDFVVTETKENNTEQMIYKDADLSKIVAYILRMKLIAMKSNVTLAEFSKIEKTMREAVVGALSGLIGTDGKVGVNDSTI